MPRLFLTTISMFLVLCCLELQAADFYVAPNGAVDAEGTEASPFGGLQQARDAIRKARKDGTIKPDEAVNVYLAPGKYFLDKTFELKKEDSGSENAPLVFRSKEPFAAELIGGVAIPDTAFKTIDDPTVLERLDASVRDRILVADLDALNVPGMKEWADQFKGRPNAPPELFLDEEPMTVARWPNEGWTGFKTTLDSGAAHEETTEETNKKAAENAGVEYVHPEVDTTKRHGGAFLYDEENLKLRDAQRIARWKVDEGVWLCGYWTHDWADEMLKVASIDPKNRALTLLGVHGYGIGGKSWVGYPERRYFALNLLEELDAPGEWYLDRKKNRLYFYPPKELKGTSILLSTLEATLVQLTGVDHVRFQGLSFGPTFGNGIDIKGGSKNAVLGCRVLNVGRHGIQMIGGNTNLVRACDLYNIGSVGVVIQGGDRKKLTPGNLRAVNNHVHHFGRLQRTYAGAFSLQGCGNVVRNNRIHDAPHAAVVYGGNENRIERNEIFDVVRETSDAGALYTGRDWTTQGNRIEENFIHHVGASNSYRTMGVYLDDCDSGDTIRRNLFYQASRAVFIGGGRDNIAANNLFVECYQGISLDSRGMSWKNWNEPGGSWHLEGKAEALDYKNPPWSERYPKLAATMENEPQAPLGCVFEKNVMVDCEQWMHLDGGVQKLLERTDLKDNVVVAGNLVVTNNGKLHDAKLPEKEQAVQKFVENVDPGFVDIEKRDFHFKTDSPLQKMLPEGFEPIPIDEIGIFVDEYRKSL